MVVAAELAPVVLFAGTNDVLLDIFDCWINCSACGVGSMEIPMLIVVLSLKSIGPPSFISMSISSTVFEPLLVLLFNL